jgi:CHAT domain-containing protein/tetratricopeptide (TPR) repeat protein
MRFGHTITVVCCPRVLAVAAAVLAALATLPADEPKARPPLTAEQKQRLAERDRLDQEALDLYRRGQPARAVAAFEKKLSIEREVLGRLSTEVAESLETLAKLHQACDDFPAARKDCQEALALRQELHGPKDWRVTDARLALADVERSAALAPRQRRRLAEADDLYDQATRSYQQGKYADGRKAVNASMAITRELLGEEHIHYAQALNLSALLYQAVGEYGGAEPLYRQALVVFRRQLGEGHPRYAVSLNNLAWLYKVTGDYARAEPLYRQAVATIKSALGEESRDYAVALNNLARLYQEMGDYEQAETLLRQAVAIQRRVLGPGHADYAHGLSGLATLHFCKNEHAEAVPLYQEALRVLRQDPGTDHPAYAQGLYNLGVTYQALGEDARAEPLLNEALQLRRRLLGEEHPDFAQSLKSLGTLYLDRGDFARAEPLLQRVLALRRLALGENHPHFAVSLHDLGALYYARGEAAEAERLLRQALDVQERLLEETFAVQSERQRFEFLGRLRDAAGVYLSVALAAGADDGQLYRGVLAWKGVVAGRQAEERVARDRPELKGLFDRLLRARTRLAQLAFAVPPPRQRAAWARQLQALRGEKEDLEGELARRSTEFGREKERRRFGAADVAAGLPEGVVLVDFFEYTHHAPPGKGKKASEGRLLAFVLGRGRDPVCVSLQAAGPVNRAVASWRKALRTGDGRALEVAAAELARRVWRPLQPRLAGARVVLVAPDGGLVELPLAVLPGRRPGSYLIEDTAVAYVTSGRHAVEVFTGSGPTPGHGLLAVGGVDYAADLGAAAGTSRSTGPRLEGRQREGFTFLAGTDAEARSCRRLFQEAFPGVRSTLLTAAGATREKFLEECGRRPRFLHLATHGFLESPARIGALHSGPGEEGYGLSREPPAEEEALSRAPLLHSGVVLAGAARAGGILTAEEVAGLDLRGTELVVLSACQSGLGALPGAEGALGLQRSFQTAGARSVVASLWKVDDAATALLMEEFYANLWRKKMSRLEALRQAQLAVLREPGRVEQRRKQLGEELAGRGLKLGQTKALPGGDRVGGRSHPALWAAFVLSGDPR